MTAPLPTWTIEELRAMTPDERRIWQVERATSWAKAAADAADDPAASLGFAFACLADAISLLQALQEVRRDELPTYSCPFGPIGPVTVLERGLLVPNREKP